MPDSQSYLLGVRCVISQHPEGGGFLLVTPNNCRFNINSDVRDVLMMVSEVEKSAAEIQYEIESKYGTLDQTSERKLINLLECLRQYGALIVRESPIE